MSIQKKSNDVAMGKNIFLDYNSKLDVKNVLHFLSFDIRMAFLHGIL